MSKSLLLSFAILFFAVFADAALADPPVQVHASRAAEKGCIWTSLVSGDPKVSVTVQQCDFGFRKITHSIEGNALVEKYSDTPPGTSGDKIIEFYSKPPKEAPDAALKRLFIDKLDDYERQHCFAKQTKSKELFETPFQDPAKTAWIIIPDKVYSAKIKKETPKDEIPQVACGEYGMPVDNRAYFEFHDGNRRAFAWVLIGQDTPLFDEQAVGF